MFLTFNWDFFPVHWEFSIGNMTQFWLKNKAKKIAVMVKFHSVNYWINATIFSEILMLVWFQWYYFLWLSNLILQEPKMISLCHQYRARPAYTTMQSDHANVQCWPTILSSHLDMPKNDSSKNERWNTVCKLICTILVGGNCN